MKIVLYVDFGRDARVGLPGLAVVERWAGASSSDKSQ